MAIIKVYSVTFKASIGFTVDADNELDAIAAAKNRFMSNDFDCDHIMLDDFTTPEVALEDEFGQ